MWVWQLRVSRVQTSVTKACGGFTFLYKCINNSFLIWTETFYFSLWAGSWRLDKVRFIRLLTGFKVITMASALSICHHCSFFMSTWPPIIQDYKYFDLISRCPLESILYASFCVSHFPIFSVCVCSLMSFWKVCQAYTIIKAGWGLPH